MRVVGSKHIFGTTFMSQTSLKLVPPATVPPPPTPIKEPFNLNTALAIGSVAAAVGFAVFSIFRK